MRNLATDAAGAATFTSNFVFGQRDGDYFAPTAESPLKHFWSLAVEEQFYLCWPPLLVVLARRPRQYRRLLAMTLGVLTVSGFTLSIVLSQLHSTWAFWLLPTRMGELLVGAALALAGPLVMSRRLRAAIGALGLAGVVLSCFLYDGVPTSWPGVGVLLPVVATAAVIAAGSGAVRPVGAAVVLALPSLQWIGRHSYALYLWHWPALVLAEAQWGPLSAAQRAGVVLAAVALSALSVRFVEDPIRHSRALTASPNASLLLGACLLLLVAGVGWQAKSSIGRLDGGVEAAAPQLLADVSATTVPTGGPAGLAATTVAAATTTSALATATSTVAAAAPSTLAVADPPTGRLAQLVSAEQQALASSSGPAAVPSNLRPSLADATERSRPYEDGCVNAAPNDSLQPCEYGVAGAGRTILLYGDSHAAQWFEPVEQYALEQGWRLVVLLKMGCPVADVDFSGQVLPYTCPPYRDRAINWIAEHQPDLVIVSNSYTQYGGDGAEWNEGSDTTFARLADATDNPILVIGDNPGSPVEVPTCLSDHLDDASACNTPRDEAVRPEQLSAEVAAARTHGLKFVDTTDWFCTDDTCPSIVGNILVLRDETHITIPMAMFLQPLVAAAIAGA
jgi:peptidoglycan/LPS O-acetylase OafA/YrhL